jgi:hypothetical protein
MLRRSCTRNSARESPVADLSARLACSWSFQGFLTVPLHKASLYNLEIGACKASDSHTSKENFDSELRCAEDASAFLCNAVPVDLALAERSRSVEISLLEAIKAAVVENSSCSFSTNTSVQLVTYFPSDVSSEARSCAMPSPPAALKSAMGLKWWWWSSGFW